MMDRREFAAMGAVLAVRAGAAPGEKVAVAAEPEGAGRAGTAVARAGGNAADAAAAACLAACVLEPHLVDLGGYVTCATVLEGKTGKVWSLDADAEAPAAARPGMFRVSPPRPGMRGINENEYACSVAENANIEGPLAVSVPGTLAGIGLLWEKWGRLKWARIVEPAQQLVEQGFPVSAGVEEALKFKAQAIGRMPVAKEHLMPGGKPLAQGQLWRRPGLEQTLAKLARDGWQDFYKGAMGRRIADAVGAAGGILTRADMAGYAPRLEPALETAWRGTRVFSARLPNGGLTSAETLHMLQHLPLPGPADPMHWHLLAETLKLAWRDRLRYCADPRFTDVPAERLASAVYAAGRCEALRQAPSSIDQAAGPGPRPSPGTIHISTGDAEGNLVSVTISHGGWFGSLFGVPGTGFLLGHGMCRFDPRPGLPNSIAPGKRPLTNLCPMVLRFPDRDVAAGVRGGRRIVSVSVELVLRLAEGLAPQQAASFPRLHLEGYEPVEVSAKLPAPIQKELQRMGHRLTVASPVAQMANIVERARHGPWRVGSGEA